MPWVLLLKKLPVRPSPPKLSIFYATPWTNEAIVNDQKERYFDKEANEWWDWSRSGSPIDPDSDYFMDLFGAEQNWAKAMKIVYKSNDIRILPGEYKLLSPEHMRDYVFGMEGEDIPTHTLIENNEASAMMLAIARDTDLRMIYEAALIDGCNPPMAEMVSMGIEIENEALEFPPVGWYKPEQFVLDMYCYENEQGED